MSLWLIGMSCAKRMGSLRITFFIVRLLVLFGTSFSNVLGYRVVDLFACWLTTGSSRSVAVWKMVPLCVLWCLWRERNDRCFEDC
jgi:hypothetical protein